MTKERRLTGWPPQSGKLRDKDAPGTAAGDAAAELQQLLDKDELTRTVENPGLGQRVRWALHFAVGVLKSSGGGR